jgi:hypothetical protein
MSYLEPEVGEVFTYRIYKRLSTRPDRVWANTYEARAEGAITTADLLTLKSRLIAFEAELHFSNVEFDRTVISTWVEDGEPYNPNTFVALPETEVGSRAGVSGTDLRICWLVRKQVASGRYGFCLYRQAIAQTDINAPAGEYVFIDPSDYGTLISAAITASGLDFNLEDGAAQLKLVLFDGNEGNTRRVSDMLSVKPTEKAFNNRYFDKPPLPTLP